jgi:hypothetical protein
MGLLQDGDGLLSVEDLIASCHELALGLDDGAVRSYHEEMDTNQDSFVDFNEWCTAMRLIMREPARLEDVLKSRGMNMLSLSRFVEEGPMTSVTTSGVQTEAAAIKIQARARGMTVRKRERHRRSNRQQHSHENAHNSSERGSDGHGHAARQHPSHEGIHEHHEHHHHGGAHDQRDRDHENPAHSHHHDAATHVHGHDAHHDHQGHHEHGQHPPTRGISNMSAEDAAILIQVCV